MASSFRPDVDPLANNAKDSPSRSDVDALVVKIEDSCSIPNVDPLADKGKDSSSRPDVDALAGKVEDSCSISDVDALAVKIEDSCSRPNVDPLADKVKDSSSRPDVYALAGKVEDSSSRSDVVALADKVEDSPIQGFIIMTINVMNSSRKGSAKAKARREHVTGLMVREYPDIAFVQECIKKDFTKINERVTKDEKDGYYFEFKDRQAGVMVKKGNKWKKVNLEEKDLVSFKKLQEAGVQARLLITEVVIDEETITIASWHGPYKEKEVSRVAIAIELFAYMNKITAGKPWIVGGDFNVDYKEVKKKVPEEIQITSGEQEKIIYFVHTDSISIEYLKHGEILDGKGIECIDHYPLLAVLKL